MQDAVDEGYYAVYLENGYLSVRIGTSEGLADLVANNTRYDDGKFHAARIVKKTRKLVLYMDDEEVMELRLPKNVAVVGASLHRGLFLGGLPSRMQTKLQDTVLPVSRGFTGCLRYFYFNNE